MQCALALAAGYLSGYPSLRQLGDATTSSCVGAVTSCGFTHHACGLCGRALCCEQMTAAAAAAGAELGTEQRNLLSVAYKNVVGACRAAFRALNAGVAENQLDEPMYVGACSCLPVPMHRMSSR